MLKFKYFLKENKMIIVIAGILLVCAIAIAIGVSAQIVENVKKTEGPVEYEKLKSDFSEIFTNSVKVQSTAKEGINYQEFVYTKFDIKEEEAGKYEINVKIPYFKAENDVLKNVNKEIRNLFGKEVVNIKDNSTVNTHYTVNYAAFANDNIVSLVIMCLYKNGANSQREIIQCYNYDIEQEKLLGIEDLVKHNNLNKNEMQKKINEEIKAKVYLRQNAGYKYGIDENSDIYLVENSENCFLGENGYLYIIYAYGNNNYTNEKDIVIF